jgi:hypothetical protein
MDGALPMTPWFHTRDKRDFVEEPGSQLAESYHGAPRFAMSSASRAV